MPAMWRHKLSLDNPSLATMGVALIIVVAALIGTTTFPG